MNGTAQVAKPCAQPLLRPEATSPQGNPLRQLETARDVIEELYEQGFVSKLEDDLFEMVFKSVREKIISRGAHRPKIDPGPPYREDGEATSEYEARLKRLGYAEE